MRTQPLFNIETPPSNPHKIEPLGGSEKITPYGGKKPDPKEKTPLIIENENKKRKSKEAGKGNIIDLEA